MRESTFAILLSILTGLNPFEPTHGAEPLEVFSVWPSHPPGHDRDVGEERVIEGRPRPFYQITGVSKPTVSVFLPPEEHRTGASILVCPGGGLQRLAIEHEGFEVAEWLLSQNIAVFLLKYRVPAPAKSGLQDAQRALGLIRSRAKEWEIDPNGIGVLGFSAGGEIAAWLSTHYHERQYEPIDSADSLSARPDFAGLIYPGGLLQRREGGIKEAIASRINRETPPMFITHAFDDFCQNSLEMTLALKRARVPAELHIFQEGGHGFGARETGVPIGNWKHQFIDWARSQGYLDKASVRQYEHSFSTALKSNGQLRRFSAEFPQATLAEAYVVQKRLVRRAAQDDRIAGFKGAGATEQAQQSMGIDGPLTGVLFQSGRLDANEDLVIPPPPIGKTMVETELGYVLGVDISYEVLSDSQARDAVSAIHPIIELPSNYSDQMGTATVIDTVASNVGSARFILGPRAEPGSVDPNSLRITINRNGETLHETKGDTVKGGQWRNLRTLLNQITSQGYTIRAGNIIISGALGKVHPGEPGKYLADFGALGSIEFEIK